MAKKHKAGSDQKREPITSDTQIRALKAEDAPYRHTIEGGKGLCIEVSTIGTKLWRYRYKLWDEKKNKVREYMYAMGEYCKAPEVETAAQAAQRRAAGQFTLEEARIERIRLRGLVKQGIHPKRERDQQTAVNRAEQANTFESVAREWLAKRARKWSAKTVNLVTGMLELDVFPKIGSKAIRKVTAADLLAIMEAVEARAPSVAFALRQHCGAVFRYGMSKLLVDGDPTAALKGAIDKPAVKHHTPLTSAEIPGLREKLDESKALSAIALQLLLVTFVRTIELRAAEWKEFDLSAAMWKVPPERMKGRREHLVPLSTQAVAFLRKLHKITGSDKYLFPNQRKPNAYMGETTIRHALHRLGYEGKFSPHGFRSTGSTHLNEMNYRYDVIEAQLAHKEKDETRGSYNRAQYMPERKAMMQEWADYIDMLCNGANVTPIRKGKAA